MEDTKLAEEKALEMKVLASDALSGAIAKYDVGDWPSTTYLEDYAGGTRRYVLESVATNAAIDFHSKMKEKEGEGRSQVFK